MLTYKWWNRAYDQIPITTKEVLSQGWVKILETSSVQMEKCSLPADPGKYSVKVFNYDGFWN